MQVERSTSVDERRVLAVVAGDAQFSTLTTDGRIAAHAMIDGRMAERVAMDRGTERLVTVVLTVSDLDRAVREYVNGFGLDLHIDDHQGDDPWTSGRHAATSWTTGAFMHFALYETKTGAVTSGAQVAFRVTDLAAAHDKAVAAGVEVIHGPAPQPWGTSARFRDHDGNVIELTQLP